MMHPCVSPSETGPTGTGHGRVVSFHCDAPLFCTDEPMLVWRAQRFARNRNKGARRMTAAHSMPAVSSLTAHDWNWLRQQQLPKGPMEVLPPFLDKHIACRGR